jgi:hypothetical protein
MNETMYREEMLWMQRSRIDWLREGDRNSRFFHQKAVWRARKNKIAKLRDENGIINTVPSDMQRMTVSYFKSLYTRDPSLSHTSITDLVQEKITEEMNDQLCKEFSDEEISDALFQIGPIKAPGPDGFPARFYQRNWVVVRAEIVAAVKQFFSTGHMPEGTNDTSIVLIPKIDNPVDLKDYRPIGLCNVLYKIVSKCLVNRLRPLLGEVISENQSAFVPGRMITDNALLAFECLHYMEHGTSMNSNFCAYKLDLSKAYDRVDWSFLENTMHRIGFSHRWVQWIMACVTTVRYSVKFNGTLLEAFSPSRGLRQGDPLSPFLFLFVADGLSALLQKEVESNGIYPLKVCRAAPGISHLLFADDTMLFFKATEAQANRVKQVINEFEVSTGQLINPSKCSIMFSTACSEEIQQEIRSILCVEQQMFDAKYLGLPTPDGRMHKGRFQSLQSRLSKSLIEWGDSLQSQSAREVLIKSIAQAIPAYMMGVFKLPFSVCDDLSRLIRDYWWGVENGKRKTHWIGWPKLQRAKAQGGLGFRDMRIFNQALLARQAWRLLEFPDSLCARVLKAKYYPRGDLLDTVFTGNPSSTWTAISHGLELLKKGIIWRIGNGQNIRVWRDNWLPRLSYMKVFTTRGKKRFRRVSELLDDQGNWKEAMVRSNFLPIDVEVILKIKPSRRLDNDLIAWQPEGSGHFTVRSAYKLAFNESSDQCAFAATSSVPDGADSCWKRIWHADVPPKVK